MIGAGKHREKGCGMELQQCSDVQLAALVRQGQGEAFAELSARYLGLVRGKARLFEGAAAPEKEDLWQEGLLGLYVAAISFRQGGGASFPTYAGVCVYNRMASAVRRHASGGNRTLNESVPLEEDRPAPSRESPESLLELREDFRALCRKMNVALSPAEHRALKLYLGGCCREEAARQAGVSLRAYDNALYRAREKLRRP